LVLDQREADRLIPVFPEADPRRHRDLRLAEEQLRELERAQRLEGVRNLGPHEHRRLRPRDVPADPLQPVTEDVPALPVLLLDLLDDRLRAVQGVRRRDLDRLEDAVVEVALDAREGADDLAVAAREANPPAWRSVALGQRKKL